MTAGLATRGSSDRCRSPRRKPATVSARVACPACKPSKLAMPVTGALGLWLVVDQLRWARRAPGEVRPVSHEDGIAALAVVSGCLALWGLVSARLERSDVSAPIAFVVLGVLATHGPTALIQVNLHSSTVRALAEVTLALVLFADASRVNARQLRSSAASRCDCSCIGLPLTIAAGAATAALLFGRQRLVGRCSRRRHRRPD